MEIIWWKGWEKVRTRSIVFVFFLGLVGRVNRNSYSRRLRDIGVLRLVCKKGLEVRFFFFFVLFKVLGVKIF